MKIFFLCRTGHHTALLAAGLYLGLIDGVRGLKAVTSLRGWDDIKTKDVGTPFYVGNDKDDNEIYTIGIASKTPIIERMVNEILRLIGINTQERRIINVSQAVSGWTKMGLAMKKMHLSSFAKMLFYKGIQSEVKRVERVLRESGIGAH